MIYLNLGCGSRYHPDWINIDIAPSSSDVMAHDLSKGIPLSDASCDVVYHSHVLEHIRRAEALPFMEECYRVLKPAGILRVAVPDLERICRTYLHKLEAGLNGDVASSHDYEWMMLEMYDQTVRENSGGGMVEYLRQDPLPNEAFVYERIGEYGRLLVQTLRGQPKRKFSWERGLRNLRQRLPTLPKTIRYWLLAPLLGKEGRLALKIGGYRLGGAVHQWMYDRYSLAQLILAAGFQEPTVQSATQSRIPNWTRFNLDTWPDGTVNKPDSLFMEAIKPVER